ncbi:chromate transporter [Cohnella lubricantis]|uniref:Chromate transporter n=1 Tax=Cohnella lubricantis TaxID=2163172 RepID=A0A841T837_9BACL|nr:chromate transporter [Cohnella lubricantis]MBB6677092.1 chromate transporter [Cohnella lubricantis]MBP2118939.1 chromate transporter [Cohnella lubricantis]
MWILFLFFLRLGFVSFGGGYALIPMIEREAVQQGWMTQDAFLNAVTVAGMSPGPIAVNLGTLIGYRTFGIGGAAAAVGGLVLPSIIMSAAMLLLIHRLRKQSWISRLFYGLQPIVTALILYAVYRLGIGSLDRGSWGGHLVFGLAIIGIGWVMLVRYRMPPVYLLLFSAIAGAAVLG